MSTYEGQGGRGFDDSELLELTGEDEAEARLLRRSLETLALGGAGDVMKEMADEVLSGRMSLRDAVNVSAYGDELITQTAESLAEWDALSESERAALVAEGERLVGEERRRIDEERRAATDDGGRRARHSGQGWSLY